MEKIWIWLNNLIEDLYKDNNGRLRGIIPIEMIIALPLLIIWFVWRAILKKNH